MFSNYSRYCTNSDIQIDEDFIMDAWTISVKVLKQEVKRRISSRIPNNDRTFGADLELDVIISEFAIALSNGNDELIPEFKRQVYGQDVF